MKLVRFFFEGGPHVGVDLPDGGGILYLKAANPALPEDMDQLLAADQATWEAVRAAAEAANPAAVLPRALVPLLAPIPRPRNIYCVGYNYRGHTGDQIDPAYPDVFAKLGDPIIGPEDAIVLPQASQQVDYEAELGVVIGRPGRDLTQAEALEHIAGYTVFNDVSARDWQVRSGQLTLAKSFDTFAPVGPHLVTPDEVGRLDDLIISVHHNDQLTVQASTADMVFPVPLLVSYISQVTELEPGDIIATGTPRKLDAALENQRWLAAGDSLVVSIDRVGTLRNPIVQAGAPA